MFNIKINFYMCLKVICEIIVNFCCVSRRILRLNMCIQIITYQKENHQKMLVLHLKVHDKWHPEKMAFRVVDIQFHSNRISTKIRPFSLGTNLDRRFPIWSSSGGATWWQEGPGPPQFLKKINFFWKYPKNFVNF